MATKEDISTISLVVIAASLMFIGAIYFHQTFFGEEKRRRDEIYNKTIESIKKIDEMKKRINGQ